MLDIFPACTSGERTLCICIRRTCGSCIVLAQSRANFLRRSYPCPDAAARRERDRGRSRQGGDSYRAERVQVGDVVGRGPHGLLKGRNTAKRIQYIYVYIFCPGWGKRFQAHRASTECVGIHFRLYSWLNHGFPFAINGRKTKYQVRIFTALSIYPEVLQPSACQLQKGRSQNDTPRPSKTPRLQTVLNMRSPPCRAKQKVCYKKSWHCIANTARYVVQGKQDHIICPSFSTGSNGDALARRRRWGRPPEFPAVKYLRPSHFQGDILIVPPLSL